jgi:ABC-type nitrate/sulfonate/bicarbonate transport system substrate-binding protein
MQDPFKSLLALGGGDLEVASTGNPTMARANMGGADFIAVAGIATTNPAQTLVTLPEIRSYQQLRGQTIGVIALVSETTALMKSLLAAHGLQEGDYDPVVAGSSNERLAALKAKRVSATLMSQPFDFMAIADGLHPLGSTVEVARASGGAPRAP